MQRTHDAPLQDMNLIRPDDWHLHLRDGAALATTVAASARIFRRAVVMPNLNPPVVMVKQALEYRRRILAALPAGETFEPLMTLYLTEEMSPEEIRKAKNAGLIGIKLYPAGATTHSDAGVQSLKAVYPLLETMQEVDLPLLIHGEVVDPEVDVFDREVVFIERELHPIVRHFPNLRVVLEHITTSDGVDFVREAGPKVAATITAHHLLVNRNSMLVGGIRPDYYCLPVLKREKDRQSLLNAATSGDTSFFLGTDSAPHPRTAKYAACGCAGMYTAPHALELYAEAFDSVGHLDRLEAFASLNGPGFYGLPINTEQVSLQRQQVEIDHHEPFGQDVVTPFRAGGTTEWKVIRIGK
ncbi:MAG: dihydroorotase [Gammaproteobacteria bacterium]|nr:MAG: dihydroorotase [Gammaproteobacteria bacterium]